MKEINQQIIEDNKKAAEESRKAWENFANGFAILADAIGGAVGQLLGIIGQLPQAIKNIGASFSGAFASFGKGGFTGIMGGIGGLAGAFGTAISLGKALFDVFKNLFGHNWAADAKKQVALLTGGLKISDDLMKQIADDAKKMGNAMAASLIHLPDIFAELGVTADNFFQLADSVKDVFSGVEQGIISTAQANKILADTFPQLLEAAMKFGGAYLDKLKEIVAAAAQTGIGVDTIKDSLVSAIKDMQEQLKSVSSDLMQNLVPAIDAIKTKAQAGGIASIILQDVEALKKAGLSTAEILQTIAPSLDAFREKLKEMGLTMGDVGLGFLNQMDQISKKFPEQVSQIGMVTNSLQLLRQLGIEPNQAAFNAMQNAFNEAVKKISGGAKLSKAQLQTILPTLIQLAQASLDYGLKLSPATIELLKQAGLWDDITNKPKATKTQTDGIADLVSALTKEPNGLIPTLQKFIDMLAQLNGMTVNTTVNTNYTTDGEPPGLGHKDPNTLRSRAGLRGMEVVDKAQQLYLLHGGEGVLGKDVMQQLKNGQGMTGGTVNIGPGAFVINGTNLNAAQLEQVIINSLRKAGALAGWKR